MMISNLFLRGSQLLYFCLSVKITDAVKMSFFKCCFLLIESLGLRSRILLQYQSVVHLYAWNGN